MTYRERYIELNNQYAYMNAIDCLYYGYGRESWNSCGIPKAKADEIWRQAIADMED